MPTAEARAPRAGRIIYRASARASALTDTRHRASTCATVSDDGSNDIEALFATWREIIEQRERLLAEIEEKRGVIQDGGPVMLETNELALEKLVRRLGELDGGLLQYTQQCDQLREILWNMDHAKKGLPAAAAAVFRLAQFLKQLGRGNKARKKNIAAFYRRLDKSWATIANDDETPFDRLPQGANDLIHAFRVAMIASWEAYRENRPRAKISKRRWYKHFRKITNEVIDNPDTDRHSKEGPKFEAMAIVAKLLQVDSSTIRNYYRASRPWFDPPRSKRRECSKCRKRFYTTDDKEYICPECQKT